MKSIYSFLLFLACSSVYSQAAYFDIKPFDDSLTLPSQHNRGLNLSFVGMNKPLLYVTIDTLSNNTYYGNQISNLSIANFSHLFQSFAINANDITDTIGKAIIIPTKKNIFFQSQVANTGTVNCDGQLSCLIDTSNNFFSSKFFAYLDASNQFSVLNAGGPNVISNKCPGRYAIGGLSQANQKTLEAYTFYFGNYNLLHPAGHLSVSVNPFGLATGTVCSGQAAVSVSGSSGTFQYSYDGGAYIINKNITGLCEGFHSVLVTNTTDTAGSYFIIANSNNVVNNPNTGGIVVDTIVYNYSNCSFNYNTPIDSAFLINTVTIDTNSIFLSWEIWQNGIMTPVSDTISYDYQQGNNMISLIVYCGSSRLTINFNSKRINDFAVLSSPTALKDRYEINNSSIYPNPFSDYLHISTTEKPIKISLYDILGQETRTVLKTETSKDGYDISVSNLKPGCYFLEFSSNQKAYRFKVIKQ
jgi:hypothetical protein